MKTAEDCINKEARRIFTTTPFYLRMHASTTFNSFSFRYFLFIFVSFLFYFFFLSFFAFFFFLPVQRIASSVYGLRASFRILASSSHLLWQRIRSQDSMLILTKRFLMPKFNSLFRYMLTFDIAIRYITSCKLLIIII